MVFSPLQDTNNPLYTFKKKIEISLFSQYPAVLLRFTVTLLARYYKLPFIAGIQTWFVKLVRVRVHVQTQVLVLVLVFCS